MSFLKKEIGALSIMSTVLQTSTQPFRYQKQISALGAKSNHYGIHLFLNYFLNGAQVIETCMHEGEVSFFFNSCYFVKVGCAPMES